MAMGEVAQRVCDTGFVRLANGIGMLAERLAADLLSGRKTKLESWEQWLATVALRRAGLDVGGGRTMGMRIQHPDGHSTEAYMTDGFIPDPDGEAAAAAFVQRLRLEQIEAMGGTLRPGWRQGIGHSVPKGVSEGSPGAESARSSRSEAQAERVAERGEERSERVAERGEEGSEASGGEVCEVRSGRDG